MGNGLLRVGLVGAGPGWAQASHLPVLASSDGIALTAVATTRRESAMAAAEAFGADHAFDSVAELAACPDVDLVAVSVKATMHLASVMTAIEAGKHVFCEWPMGANVEQSRQIAEAAARANVRNFVGLQGEMAPAVRHARGLVREGYLGRVHSVSMWGAFSYWGDRARAAYVADVLNGVTVLTIPGGHGLHIACHVLDDEIERLSGWETHRRTAIATADETSPVPMTSPDQFAAVGTMRRGALVSAHCVGVAPRGETWRLQLVGDKGELLLEADGLPEIAPVRLSGTNDHARPAAPIAVESEGRILPSGPAQNVTYLWAQILADLRTGSHGAPDFAVGMRRREMLDAIARSHSAASLPLSI